MPEKGKAMLHGKFMAVIIILLAANLCFTAWLAMGKLSPAERAGAKLGLSEAEQTYLFIGTNDKDTHRGEIPFDEAKAAATAVLAAHGITDFTTWDAQGGWLGPDGVAISEQTIVYILYTQDEALLRDVADAMCRRLNQASVSMFMPEGRAGLYFVE
jgi:hypothetical protein